jgi:hypothetical protein
MKQIVKKLPSNEIAVTNIPSGGIIGFVYKNKLSILYKIPSTFIDSQCAESHKHYFAQIINQEYMSCASETQEKALNKVLSSESEKLYYFEDLQDLARSIINNGWE